MENAADALKMAAAVLIFVLALSISINAFGQVRKTSQTILDYRDREYDYTYVEDNGTTERIVGAETIVPSIYRAYQENYKIVFDIREIDCLYKKKIEGSDEPIKYIDLEKESLANEEQKRKFIQAILYGTSSFGSKQNDIKKEFSSLGIELKEDGIFNTISAEGKKYRESLGVYYQEEVESGETSQAPEANKTKKRVITYSNV